MKWDRSTGVFLPNAPPCWPTDREKAPQTGRREAFVVPGAGACSFSNGELGLSDKLAENDLKSRGGQEVRFVGLPVDTSMLTSLHSLPDAGAVVNRIKERASEHYSHAGHIFLRKLTKAETLNTVRTEIGPAMTDAVRPLVPKELTGRCNV